MTAGTARAQETRRGLVRAAIQTIQETGSLNPEQVAKRARVSPATFYTHFSNKDVALTAVVGEVVDILNSLAESLLGPERLLDLGLERVLHDFARSSRDVYVDHFAVIRLAQTRIHQHRPMRDAFLERQATGLEILETFLARGVKAGLIRPLDISPAAVTLMAALQSLNNRLVFESDDYLDHLTTMLVSLLAPEV